MNETQKNRKGNDDEALDLVPIFRNLWGNRRRIFTITLTFLVLGVLVAILTPKEFTASSTFLPQAEDSSGGGRLGGLASIAGINIGGVSDRTEIPPSLYPRIVKSIKFKRALLDTPITLEDEGLSITYRTYYEDLHSLGALGLMKKYTIGLPGVIMNLFRKNGKSSVIEEEPGELIKISSTEAGHFRRMEEQIIVTPNEREGLVELSFSMPEPLMAAQMAKAAEELLQEEVISFKIQNARVQMEFTEEQFKEKTEEFEQKQNKLANFRDRNQNIASAVAMNELQRLEAEYNFSYNLYTELAKQFEQSKLQVSKDTPVFSVINPVSIPNNPSAPNKKLTVIGFTLLGFFGAIALVLTQNFWGDFKKKLDQEI